MRRIILSLVLGFLAFIAIDAQSNKEEIEYYQRLEEESRVLDKDLTELTHLPSKTLDDIEITIHGNIELPEEKEIRP